jgi:hypothetical protein
VFPVTFKRLAGRGDRRDSVDVRYARRVLLGTSLVLTVSSFEAGSCQGQKPMLSEHAVAA